MERFDQIYNLFNDRMKDSITNYDALKEYIIFCLVNDRLCAEKGVTSHHHILPKCGKANTFHDVLNLTYHPWNGAHLTFYHHYYAHFLLTKAINNRSIRYSFIMMHFKDHANARIRTDDLIDEQTFNTIMKQRNEDISTQQLTKIHYNGELISKAKLTALCRKPKDSIQIEDLRQRMKGENNIVYRSGVVDKIRNRKSNTFIDGKNIDQIGAERAAITKKTVYVNEFGNETTIYKETGKKIKLTLTTEFVNDEGELTTIAKERAKKHSKTLITRGKRYILRNVFDDNFQEILYAKQIRELSPGLESKTKENYLGMSVYGRNKFIREKRSHLIGLYVILL